MKICTAEEILALRRRGLPLQCREALETIISKLENEGFAFTFSWTEDPPITGLSYVRLWSTRECLIVMKLLMHNHPLMLNVCATTNSKPVRLQPWTRPVLEEYNFSHVSRHGGHTAEFEAADATQRLYEIQKKLSRPEYGKRSLFELAMALEETMMIGLWRENPCGGRLKDAENTIAQVLHEHAHWHAHHFVTGTANSASFYRQHLPNLKKATLAARMQLHDAISALLT